MKESVQMFGHLIKGVAYMHAQRVAHLDLDVYNIAIDKTFRPRIIDFGSSQLFNHKGLVCVGNVGLKCKPLFVAPEVYEHSKLREPRPGFDGARADLWSLGVIVSSSTMNHHSCPYLTKSIVCAYQLVQCVVWGFREGPNFIERNPNWRRNILDHIELRCDPMTCYLCDNLISIPCIVGLVITRLLQKAHQRPSAYAIAMALERNDPTYLGTTRPREEGLAHFA